MKKIISNQEKKVLECFTQYKIPDLIKYKKIDNIDLMEYYEELDNYSDCLLSNREVDFNTNTYRTGKAFIFNQEYKNILFGLANNNDDLDLKVHCYLSLAVLSILQKYTKQK